MPEENAQTLALCVIAKNEEDTIGKMLDTVLPYVDAFYLTDTGSTDRTIEVAKEKAKEYNVPFHSSLFTPKKFPDFFKEDDTQPDGYRLADFSEARNFNFAKAQEDFIFWLDCDDELVNGNLLGVWMDRMVSQNSHSLAFVYNYDIDKDGFISTKHWKERLIRNGDWFHWAGKIHEALLAKDPTILSHKHSDIWVNHMTTPERQQRSNDRNLKVLLDDVADQKERGEADPRTMFYLANAQLLAKEWRPAVDTLKAYLNSSGWDEERYQAWQLLGEAYEQLKKRETALECFLLSMKERPAFPDAYFNLARMYHEDDQYEKCLAWTEIGFRLGRPDTNLIWFPADYTYKPAVIAGYSALHSGDIKLSRKYVDMAIKYAKDNEYVKALDEWLTDVEDRRKVADSYLTIAKYMKAKGEENKIMPLIAQLPKSHQSDPIVSRIRNRYQKPRVWDDDEVAIFCAHSAESWSPKSLDRGIGGSEEAVIHLAKRWQAMGYKVTVFNWCEGEDGEYDGVTYKNYWDFNPEDTYNTLIVWRAVEFFDSEIRAKRMFLDLHDVPIPASFTEERLAKIDKIFVKTKYHRDFLPAIPDEKFEIVGNGIDPDAFMTSPPRQKGKMVYTSSADRGLEHLLEMWGDIKKKIPEAELHVFYGWGTFDKLNANNPERMAWKKRMVDKMDQPGIIDRGRVNHEEMAHELLTADLWTYPTHFEEIHCISAAKAQAAGCIPVVTNYAALKETVQRGLKVDGDPWDEDYPDNYIKAVVEAYSGDWKRGEMHDWAIKKFSWDTVAKTWAWQFTQDYADKA